MIKKMFNIMFATMVILYVLFLLWCILFKYVSPIELFSHNRYFTRTVNLVPFNDIRNGYFNKLDIYGNIILFIPLGIYLNIIKKNLKVYKSICIIILVSFIFEISQYVFRIGASDVTDIITNTIGGIIGIVIYFLFLKVFKGNYKTKVFITVLSLTIMTPVEVLMLIRFMGKFRI